MGKRDNNFMMLLDIDKIFNFEELEKIESIKTIAESESIFLNNLLEELSSTVKIPISIL